MDTETTKNNLLSEVAMTWLGHLSFPCWLLSFVYPHTSWMLMADSLLVYTSGRRRKTAHCCMMQRRKRSRMGRGGSILVTTGRAPKGFTWCPRAYISGGWQQLTASSSSPLHLQNLKKLDNWTSLRQSRWGGAFWEWGYARYNRSSGRV